jgi:hypothetical protein
MTCQTIYVIVIYATSFCVNWAFIIARGTRLVKHERSDLRPGGQLEKPNLPRNELHTKFYCLKRRP